VNWLCQAVGVSRSGYYAARQRPPSPRAQGNQALVARMRVLHAAHEEAYGAIKLWQALRDEGVACGRHRVARLRRAAGLETRRRRRWRLTAEARHNIAVAPNRLNRQFQVAQPNRVWMGDITGVPTRAGWLFLAVLLDAYSRRVVGWAMDERMTEALVLGALQMALTHRQPRPGLLHHTDQGRQYTGTAYQQQVAQAGMIGSMSRKGNCYDNAVVESFFSSLKNEVTHHRRYQTREEARAEIFHYIELFYNRRRLHQTLGYVSPVAYEARRDP